MKTNLNRTITTKEEAEAYLIELQRNGEEHDPDWPSNQLEWDGGGPTAEQADRLDQLMEQVKSTGIDVYEVVGRKYIKDEMIYSMRSLCSNYTSEQRNSLEFIIIMLYDLMEGDMSSGETFCLRFKGDRLLYYWPDKNKFRLTKFGYPEDEESPALELITIRDMIEINDVHEIRRIVLADLSES